MEVIYRTLFNVEFFHEFYKDLKGEYTHRDQDINIVPTRDCMQSMLDQGLFFRVTADGFSVLYQAYKEDALEKPLIPLTEARRFSFQLFAKSAYMVHYSSLPLDARKSEIYYLNNLVKNVQNVNGNDENLLVKDTNSPYLSLQDQVSLSRSRFTYGFKKIGDSASLTIQDRNGATVYADTLNKLDDGIPTAEKNFRTTLNLDSLGKGLFTLKVDGSEKEKILIDNSLLANKPFGLIDIYYDPAVPADYSFADPAGNVTSRQYTMRVDRRKTIWKYLVGLKYRDDLDPAHLEVKADPSVLSATFTRRAAYIMGDGTKIVPFDSSSIIPLSKEPLKGIKLVRVVAGSGSGSSSTEETKLPNPEVSNIKTDNGTVYSEVYIYV